MSSSGRPSVPDLTRAFAAIDTANAEDPTSVPWEGSPVPKALLQGRLATVWLDRLVPHANDGVRLACRAHHLRRWAIPRSSYPDGRPGYLRWRRDQKTAHAEALRGLLEPLEVADATVSHACRLVQRADLGSDPDAQAVEDVACLVFCQTDLDDLLARLGPQRTADAVVKTTRKMSAAAVALVPDALRSDAARALVAGLAAPPG